MSGYFNLNKPSNIEKARIDTEYAGELIDHHSNLIWHTLHKYLGDIKRYAQDLNMEVNDLYQLGCIGFIDAINRFDPGKGYAFSTYLTYRILGEVQDHSRQHGSLIKFSRTYIEYVKQICEFTDSFEQKHNRRASVDEISKATGIQEDTVITALTIGTDVRLLSNDGSYESSYLPIFNVSSDSDTEEEVVDELYSNTILDELNHRLNKRNRDILQMRLGGIPPSEMARLLGLGERTIYRALSQIKDMTLLVLEELEKDSEV